MILTLRALGRLGSLGLVVASVAACSSKTKDGTATASDSAVGGMAPAPGAASADQPMAGVNVDASMKGMQGSGSMAMTGDADRDFLRMMSDHHKGMIAMAHMTKERNDVGSAAVDAKKIDAAQDKELDRMVTMLEKDFKDAYKPKVMPDNQAMADMMKDKNSTAYERAFYENTIRHHQEAVKMVNEYLPKAKSAAIKQMAEKIKADQTKEVAEFQKKISQLK